MVITTLTGANSFALRVALEDFTAKFLQTYGEFGLERLDGSEVDYARLQESVQSLPFLADKKMVVLRTPGAQKQFSEQIHELLKGVPATTDLIFIEPKLDKRSSYYKTLKKETDFKEFTELDTNGLGRWSAEYASQQKGELTATDARLLVERTGPNQHSLKQELDKLLAYDPRISRTTIELLVEPQPQSTVFSLLDAVFSGNANKTIELYAEQRRLKVEPQAIMSMLAWQLHIFAVVKVAGRTRNSADIASQAKVSPYVVQKSLSAVQRLTASRLKQMIAELLALDIRMKTTAIDADESLQTYLLQLTG